MSRSSHVTVYRRNETTLVSRQVIVYVDGERVAALKSGESVDIPVGRSNAEVALLSSWPSPLWFGLFFLWFAMLVAHVVVAQGRRPLNAATRLLAVTLRPEDIEERRVVISVRWAGLKAVRETSVDQLEADEAPPEPIVRLGELHERVVHRLPYQLAEGDEFTRTVELKMSSGLDISERQTSSNVRFDAGILEGVVEKHYGEDRVQREAVERTISDTIKVTGKADGAKYEYQWVEYWRSGTFINHVGGEVGSFDFRENEGPRTIKMPLDQ